MPDDKELDGLWSLAEHARTHPFIAEVGPLNVAEARRIVALDECATHGHDWDILAQNYEPVALLCSRCGARRRVSKEFTADAQDPPETLGN